MNTKHYILSVLLLWTSALFAQDIKVVARVSKNQVAVGEAFEISFSITGNIESFNPPSFKGFQIVSGPNQSSSYTSINGVTSSSVAVSYDLVAVREGEYTIGSANIWANKKSANSNNVKIVVSGKATGQGGQPNQQGQDESEASSRRPGDLSKRLFIRAIPSKTNVYQGEQISVSYKLYTNIDLVGNSLDKLPDFNGFWSQEIKTQSPNVVWQTETYNGNRYNTAVLKQIILFPERYGKLSLDPLAMTFMVRQSVASNDPIEQFFGKYEEVKTKVVSPVITINVKPLPELGKPIGFQGAVGNFSLVSSIDKTSLKANEALNYNIKISGSGNLKLLKAPEVSLVADIEKYDPKVTDNIVETVNGVSGSRTYNFLLIPRHEGNYTIDPFKFSYFNPASQKYVTLSGEPYTLKVAKGDPGSNVTAFSSPGQQDIKMIDKDIRYIKTTDDDFQQDGNTFYGSITYYLLLAGGPLLFLLAFGYRNWHRENNKDIVKVRGRNANKVAAKHLANAQKQLTSGDKKEFYEAIYRGLYGYLSDKLNISVADLNKENINEQLRAKATNEILINELTETLDLCEMARYAPVSGISEQEVFDKAKNIINEIEKNA